MQDPDFSSNPFASPLAEDNFRPREDWGDEELIRHEHLKHEASIRSIGILYFIPATLLGLGTIFGLVSAIGALVGPNAQASVFAAMLGVIGIYLLFAVLFGWCALGLRSLDRRVRWPVMILSAIGLIGFPLGTIINGYALYLVGSKKGKFIMTPEYQRIRKATPHIKYKSSFLMLLLLGFCIVALIIAIALAFGG